MFYGLKCGLSSQMWCFFSFIPTWYFSCFLKVQVYNFFKINFEIFMQVSWAILLNSSLFLECFPTFSRCLSLSELLSFFSTQTICQALHRFPLSTLRLRSWLQASNRALRDHRSVLPIIQYLKTDILYILSNSVDIGYGSGRGIQIPYGYYSFMCGSKSSSSSDLKKGKNY